MKAYEKAIMKHPSLSRMDLVENSCPDLLLILDAPDNCGRGVDINYADCEKCWDREVED